MGPKGEMLNQVQHDMKKQPCFKKDQIISEKSIKSNDISKNLVMLDSNEIKYNDRAGMSK